MEKVVKSSIENPFIGRTDGVVFAGQVFEDPDKDDIVEYYEKEKITKIGEGEDDYKKENVVVEYSRVNRRDYINSFRNDVGILNILRKCALAGEDPTDGRFRSKQDYVDMSEMPTDMDEAFAAIKAGSDAWKNIDPALKGKATSIEQFVELMGDEQVYKFITDEVAKREAAKVEASKKEGE